MIRFTVCGSPRTKKTSNRLVRAGQKPRILPSKAWERWAKTARIEGDDWQNCVISDRELMVQGDPPIVESPHNCRAIFYRDAKRGDAVGYYQGLADLLERRGIISNDKWLVSWDGSRLLVDHQHPRVKVELTPGVVGGVA